MENIRNTSNPAASRIASFPPVVDQYSKILILGSIPGVKSLEMQQYYAHPQNKFWKIIFEICGAEFSTDYDAKINLVKSSRIALWDVIDTCERNGSLDSEIRNEEANQIAELLQQYPNIGAIFCNGQKAFKNLLKILGKGYDGLPVAVLPSTSPAHAGMPYQKKLEAWSEIRKYLP